jgi:hypothetical protein
VLWLFGGVMPEQFYAWVLNADGEAFKTRKYNTHESFERIAQVYLSAPDVVKLDVFRLDVTGKTKLVNTLRKK